MTEAHSLYIGEYPGAIAADVCARLVAACPANGPAPALPEELATAVMPALQKALRAYARTHLGLAALARVQGLGATPPVLEGISPAGERPWELADSAALRDVAVLGFAHLNTVAGGELEFAGLARRSAAHAGTIVLFPPYWTHFHRVLPPVGETKYALRCSWRHAGGSG